MIGGMAESTSTDQPVVIDGVTDEGLVDVDGIVLTKTGWIRAAVAGETFRLRRPFFGELRKLRTALEAVTDEINTTGEEADGIAAQLVEMAKRYKDMADADIPARERTKNDKLRDDAKTASRRLVEVADDLRVGWWTLVFETLCVDTVKVPADWPSWVVDPNLPNQVMQHWRSAPLAPGK